MTTTMLSRLNSDAKSAVSGHGNLSEACHPSSLELFQHLHEGVAYCQMIVEEGDRLDFVYLAVNDAFEKLTGWKSVVGRRATEVRPEIREREQRLLQTYARVARTGVSERFETCVESLRTWFAFSVYSPKQEFFVVIFNVINEPKEVERALRESEAALRSVFDDAPLPYHEIDHNGMIVRVNRIECDLLGFRAAEMVGRPIWDFLVPEEREEARASIARRLLGRDDPSPVERRFRTSNGALLVFQIHVHLIKNPAGTVIGMRSAMIDLTESKRLNSRLAHERQLLKILMDQSPDRIYFKDTEGRFTLVNAAQARAMGRHDPGELVGKSDKDFFTPEHAEAALLDESDLVQERTPVVMKEEKETWPDGRETWASTTKLPWRDVSGGIAGTFGISRDVTERRRVEQAFQDSENRLKLAQEALSLGTWEFDLATGSRINSEKVIQLYGHRGQTMDFQMWLSSVHPSDRERARDDFYKGVESEETVHRRFRVIWPDGSVHWLHSICRAIRNSENRAVRVVGVDFDITESSRTEERLRILSAAVEQSPVSIVITDLRGRIEYVNSKMTEVTGYTRAELIGQKPSILKSGETSAEEYDNLWHTIRTGEWRGTFHNRKKNGELFWEAAVIRPIRDVSGVPTHYLAVKEDITERKAAEEALRMSEDRFRIAAENAADIIFEWDLDSSESSFLGGSFPLIDPPRNTAEWLRLIHPEDVEHVTAAVQRHRTAGEPFRQEYRMICKDGSIIDVAARANIVGKSQSGHRMSIGAVSDISARKAAERANAELAAIVESVDSAIYSRDLAGKVLTWNLGAERIYGYSPQEIIGRDMQVLFPPDRSGELAMFNQKLSGGGRITHQETVRVKKSGEPIPVLVSASPICNRAGEVVGAAHVAWDITQIKLLQQQLAQAQKLESIGQLAAGIAHEINTPVQYIGDNVVFLKSAFEDLFEVIRGRQLPDAGDSLSSDELEYLRKEVPQAIAQMQEGVDRVAGIVRAMKRFSHPGAVEKIPIDINQAIDSTILVSRNEWKYVADLTTDFDRCLSPVPCIAGEFNQVILNLIVNAAHAIADVKGAPGVKGAIHVSTKKNGAFAEIRVSDTGCGISAAIRSKVFDPFFTTKAVGKGTGQGLSIAHSVIVQKHRGSISFESDEGKGTTFLIQLPLENGEKQQ